MTASEFPRRRQISITLDPEILDDLDSIVAGSLSSRSLIIENAVRQYVRQQTKNKSRRRSPRS